MELGRFLISSEDWVFTAPCVPTGKKQGVKTSPWPVCKTPDLADEFSSLFTIVKMDFNLWRFEDYLLKVVDSSSMITFKMAAIGTASSIPMMPPIDAPSSTKMITNIGWMPTLLPMMCGDMTRLSINWTIAKTIMMKSTYIMWIGMIWSVMR